MIFLGVDVGGSKTHALLCDENGRVLGFGTGPGGNPEMVGYDGLALAMQTAIKQARKGTGIKLDQIEAAGFGIAGYDWPSQYSDTLQAVQSLGLSGELVIENDAVPPLWAGTTHGWGISACVGTGNNVRGIDAQGRTGRITGNSSAYGEYGGASEIMDVALLRIAWMWSGRGKKTDLARILIEDCGAKDLEDLIEGIVGGRYELKASQAPLVVASAEKGDEVAGEVVRWNAEELAESVLAVAGQLELIDQLFEVVMSGVLFHVSELYRQVFIRRVVSRAPQADCRLCSAPPVVGAALMAMNTGGLEIEKAREALYQLSFSSSTG
jgi:N-acetylglucosamine kinase-like BadF-type ATPase